MSLPESGKKSRRTEESEDFRASTSDGNERVVLGLEKRKSLWTGGKPVHTESKMESLIGGGC